MRKKLKTYDLFDKIRKEEFSKLKVEYSKAVESARPGTEEKAHSLYRNSFLHDFKQQQTNPWQ